MSKYCGKCGKEIAEDDFLCPYCGAIWGDRIYRVTQGPSHFDQIEEAPAEQDGREEVPVAQEPPVKKKSSWYNLWMLGAVLVSVILFVILIGPEDQENKPTITTVPTTSTVDAPTTSTLHPPIVTNPTVITMQRYTVQVIDQNGYGIPGVRIKNENALTSSSVIVTVTDSEGVATFMAFPDQAYVCLLDVPQGYSRELIGVQIPYAKDTSFMVVVVDKSNEGE